LSVTCVYQRQFAKRTFPRAVGDHETEKQTQSYADVWKCLFNFVDLCDGLYYCV